LAHFRRIHPRLKALDSLKATRLTYDGWEADARKAEDDYHVKWPILFNGFLDKMRRKQASHEGDRSHPQLQTLDKLKRTGLTYNGWKEDLRKAEEKHVEYPTLFDGYVEKMQRKQALHVGDYSHPQVKVLDNLKRAGLTYAGWQADIRKAEDRDSAVSFNVHVEGIRKKQQIHMGDRSHPQLQVLDNLIRVGLTYIGWRFDVREAEEKHVKYPSLFDGHVEGMRKKQALHMGDRSHPQLQALDSMKRSGLTYEGWESDVRMAEDYHVEFPYLCDKCLQEIRSKQTSYSSQLNARRLPAHVSPIPHQPRESDHDIKEPVRKKARRIDDRQNKLSEIQESKECVVCLSSKRTHAFVPCGHMCVCNGCAVSIQGRKCPICRKSSQQIIKIFQ
jgi:hypothetical protein